MTGAPRRGAVIAILCAAAAAAALLSLAIGPAALSAPRIAAAFGGHGDPIASLILFHIRLPRVLLGLLVGAMLGLAGAALQGYLRNPLADPGVLGATNAAALGAVISQPVGPGRIAFSPWVTWQSRVFFDDDNDIPALQQPPRALVADNIQDETQKGYALVNARLGYEAADRAWRIEAFVENAFDKKYIRDAGNTGDGLGLPTFISGDPRFYGVSATVRFGGAR